MTSLTSDSVVSLQLNKSTYVAGDAVTGRVALNGTPADVDRVVQVVVKLSGTVTAYVPDSSSPTPFHETRVIFDIEECLWSRTNENRLQSRVFPFEIRLPLEAPPSFYAASSLSTRGEVAYAVEVVCICLYRPSHSLKQALDVLPRPSVEQCAQTLRLEEGWDGKFTARTVVHKTRKSLWSKGVEAQVKVMFPAMESLPLGQAIPFTLLISVWTEHMSSSTMPEKESARSALFPPVPDDPATITLRLGRRTRIRAKGHTTTMLERLHTLGSFGEAQLDLDAPVRRNVLDPVWVPDGTRKNGRRPRGQWKREVLYKTNVVLDCPPTFTLATLECEYHLYLRIPFPGDKHDMQWEIPIHINSGVVSEAYGWSLFAEEYDTVNA